MSIIKRMSDIGEMFIQSCKTMKDSLKGQAGFGVVTKVVLGIVGIMVVFLLVANLYPEAASAGDELNASGFPLGRLFIGGGLVFILVAVGILLYAIRGSLGLSGSKK